VAGVFQIFPPDWKVGQLNAIQRRLTKACSVPEPKLKVLIDALGYKHIPFKPQKSVGHSPPQEKNQSPFIQKVMDG